MCSSTFRQPSHGAVLDRTCEDMPFEMLISRERLPTVCAEHHLEYFVDCVCSGERRVRKVSKKKYRETSRHKQLQDNRADAFGGQGQDLTISWEKVKRAVLGREQTQIYRDHDFYTPGSKCTADGRAPGTGLVSAVVQENR